ncbi:hypothetical protein ACHAXT_009712 [Thalassiosira profunda]
MHLHNAAIAIALLVAGGPRAVHARDIEAVAAPGTYILHEDSSSAVGSHHRQGLAITSNVPVSVFQYNDDQFMYGEQPVSGNEAYLTIISDCDATTFVPRVTWGEDSLDVSIEGVLDPNYMTFLPPSSYNASWSYTSYWCEAMKDRTYPPSPVPEEDEDTTRLTGGGFSLKAALWRALGRTPKQPERDEEEATTVENVCTVNVEVMLNGCEHGANVTAPKVRSFDGEPINVRSGPSATDECATDYEAEIVFIGPPTAVDNGSMEVPRLDEDEDSYVCSRAIEGRPFVDATGRTLRASPVVVPLRPGDGAVESQFDGLADLVESRPVFEGNRTVHPNQLALGEKWTTSALGEHASVASFAAFSIALMTNGAPSDLVQDALEAALDEVRHAATSFDIASRLLGRDVGPGPLPASHHEFGSDLMALAIAVAREGCVDETLSALEAAAEVDALDLVLANGAEEGSKYYAVDEATLAWIREELHTIAMEEGGHAALAWRTFHWVCRVDADACDAVKQNVLSEAKLEGAFRRRFGSVDGIMAESWRKIYSSNDVDAQVCTNSGADGEEISDGSLVSTTATNVLRGVMMCS